MSEPLTFPSTTPITGLPLLFSGQSQKEFFVNQAFTTIDAILFHSIEASLIEPPAESAEGESFRVLPAATSDWEGHDDAIAVKIAGTWHFITPVEGTEATISQRSNGLFSKPAGKAQSPLSSLRAAAWSTSKRERQ
ncbi:MAG: DUF2793 domain-containing protein [Pseudomonadota bacterium]